MLASNYFAFVKFEISKKTSVEIGNINLTRMHTVSLAQIKFIMLNRNIVFVNIVHSFPTAGSS